MWRIEGRICFTHGRWRAARLGFLSALIADAVSHIGEMAKRVRARSSGPNLQRIIQYTLNHLSRGCKREMLLPERMNG